MANSRHNCGIKMALLNAAGPEMELVTQAVNAPTKEENQVEIALQGKKAINVLTNNFQQEQPQKFLGLECVAFL